MICVILASGYHQVIQQYADCLARQAVIVSGFVYLSSLEMHKNE